MTISYQSTGENKENIMDGSFEETETLGTEDRPLFYFEVPEMLKVAAERDNSFVSKKKRLLVLPAKPNVVTILEGYVKNFAVNILCSSAEKVKPGAKPIFIPERSIDLCKEIVSDLRIMFDFILPTDLLYENEKQQYITILETYIPPAKIEETPMPSPVKTEASSTMDTTEEAEEAEKPELETVKELPEPPAKRRRSSRAKSSQQDNEQIAETVLQPEPETPKGQTIERRSSRSQTSEKKGKKSNAKATPDKKDSKPEIPKANQNNVPDVPEPDETPTRRLTRQSSAVEVKKPTPPTAPVTPTTASQKNKPGSALKQASKRRSRSTASASEKKVKADPTLEPEPEPVTPKKEPTPPISPLAISPPRLRSRNDGTTEPEEEFPLNNYALTDVMRWKLIPNDLYYQKPPIPSIVYGAQHLLRLFCRISDFVSQMPMSDRKRKVLARHLEQLLAYLKDRRDEIFLDNAYEGHSDVRTRRH